MRLAASVVRGAWGARDAQCADTAREASALRRVQAMFRAGPRDRYHQPLTSAHEYVHHLHFITFAMNASQQHSLARLQLAASVVRSAWGAKFE